MTDALCGKTALVTGAAQGIGRAIAETLARHGAVVISCDREAAVAGRDEQLEARIRSVILDVTDSAAVSAIPARFGPIDILVNCAGVVPVGTVVECSDADWQLALDVNVTAMFRLVRAVMPEMVARGDGAIVNMASVVSNIKAARFRAAYAASKAAVIGLTKSIAIDYAAAGIRCNAIAPGTVDTPSWRARVAAADDPEGALRNFVARQPLGRVGQPQEIADLVLYLSSSAGRFATGSVFVLDGGMSL